MPLTPFHIVAGASIKSVFPKNFSWSVFTLTNIIIDTEVLYYLFTTGEFSHKFFHTILGASLIAILCASLGKPICELGLRIWNNNLQNEKSMERLKWLNTDVKINIFPSLIGAFTGAYTHLILDSVMHADIVPLAPFTNLNNLLGIISIENLQYICLLIQFCPLIKILSFHQASICLVKTKDGHGLYGMLFEKMLNHPLC